jgi:dTDP-4-dehydrorhamnose 3,5-epimerase
MKFTETTLPGAFVIDLEPRYDERGFFARSFCRDEFAKRDLHVDFVQCNISFNLARATLRGMHYQDAPHAEVKMIRVTAGAIFDVIVDIRPESPAFGKWLGIELSAKQPRMFYVPKGLAHGFVTLRDETEVFYQMGNFYHAESACGIRWNDPFFNIRWPVDPSVISERDSGYPDFHPGTADNQGCEVWNR